MILRGSYKPEVFLRLVAKHVCPTDPVASLGFDNVYYLGAGYWRATPTMDGTQLCGLRLINPDRTYDEIATVERAVCILGGFKYHD